jgi:hypothetical protein
LPLSFHRAEVIHIRRREQGRHLPFTINLFYSPGTVGGAELALRVVEETAVETPSGQAPFVMQVCASPDRRSQ